MPTHGTRDGSLEHMRLTGGAEALRAGLRRAAGESRERTVRMLENPSLRFPSLYLLTADIGRLRLYPELGARNQTALRLCVRQSAEAQPVSTVGPPPGSIAGTPEQTRAALRWMLQTGLADDGLDDDYDQLMDTAAALLVITWHDLSLLPQMIPVVFRRHRRERAIHDLLWVIFRSRDPRILDWFAAYLHSRDKRDVELADKLLRGTLEPDEAPPGRPLRPDTYRAWLAENRSYLYFTGEGFQQSSEPRLCRVALGAKYLGRPVAPGTGRMQTEPTPEEAARLQKFEALAPEDRRRLARISRRMRRTDPNRWRRWVAGDPARLLPPAHPAGGRP